MQEKSRKLTSVNSSNATHNPSKENKYSAIQSAIVSTASYYHKKNQNLCRFPFIQPVAPLYNSKSKQILQFTAEIKDHWAVEIKIELFKPQSQQRILFRVELGNFALNSSLPLTSSSSFLFFFFFFFNRICSLVKIGPLWMIAFLWLQT